VSKAAQGRGAGTALLAGLVAVSEANGYWTLQAQIIVANHASRALHLKNGFREVGIRERLGQVGGVWHDVALLEHRSQRAGGPGLPTRTCDTA
jgi:L-amino acid N-acyltransferase YncA